MSPCSPFVIIVAALWGAVLFAAGGWFRLYLRRRFEVRRRRAPPKPRLSSQEVADGIKRGAL